MKKTVVGLPEIFNEMGNKTILVSGITEMWSSPNEPLFSQKDTDF